MNTSRGFLTSLNLKKDGKLIENSNQNKQNKKKKPSQSRKQKSKSKFNLMFKNKLLKNKKFLRKRK